MDKKQKIALGTALAALGLLAVLQGWWSTARTVETLPFSQFQTLLAQGGIAEVTVGPTSLDGRFRTPHDGRDYFTTTRVDPALAADLEKAGVTFTGARETTLLRDLLSWLLPVVVFFGLWLLVIRRLGDRQGLGGAMTVGKSKAKVYVERQVGVSFDDVAGVDEAKRELQEIVAFLRNPADYSRLGARAPKGVLLIGPPGTGKTLLARAVAGEAGVAFFTISGSEFVEMFVGVGAARVRDLFEQARRAAPCIIFIDELDALGRMRGAGGPYGGNDEKEQTLNQLLTELDGFDPSAGIILLAATNRPEILDPALLRAGRFDRQVLVDRPDRIGRRQILAVHVRRVRLDKGVDLEQVAALTPGLTGADLANLVNEAALLATRRGAQSVTLADFSEAIERLVAGLEKKSRVLSPAERARVAYHEMGHALVAANLAGVDPVQKISIIPRGIGALGYTLQRPTEERYLMTTADLVNRITVLMGGRAAELLRFGEISTGAADDLQRATEIAREMVTRYGMDEALGNRVYAPARQTFLGPLLPEVRETSEATTREIDLAVRTRVEAAFAAARTILEARRSDLEAGATLLLTREILTADDFPALKPATAPAAA